MFSRGRQRLTPSILLISALVAASCASGEDGNAVTTVDDAPTSEAAPSTDDEPPATDDAPSDTTADTEAPPATDEAPEIDTTADNFDSFRGVTADTIKVGITVPDFEALQSAGLPNFQGSNEIAFQAFIDSINAAGGIHGRMIEPVYVPFDFLNPATQDKACTALTEDEEVFIVLYGLLAESNLCLTELHDTMVMTSGFQSAETRERSGDTLWLQLETVEDEAVSVLASVVADSGELEGRTIGILANGGLSNGAAGPVVEAALADAGFDSILYTTGGNLDDEVARRADIEAIAQKLNADGVDFVFNLLGGGTGTQDFADAGFVAEGLAFMTLSPDTEASDKSLIDGALTVAEINADVAFQDPEYRAACVDPILEAFPELTDEFADLPDDEGQLAGEPSWFLPAAAACNQLWLLKTLGEIAGADLTNATFLAALDELGPVQIYGYGQGTFRSTDKWDGNDEFYLQAYNAETNEVEAIGDGILIER